MRKRLLRASEGAISGVVAAGVVTVALRSMSKMRRRRVRPMWIVLRELRRVMRGVPRAEEDRTGVPWVLARSAGYGALFGALGLGKHFPLVSGLSYGSLLWLLGRTPLSRVHARSFRSAVFDLTYGVTLALGTMTLDRATRKLDLV